MARPATSRRSADRRTSRLDRPGLRHLPRDPGPSPATGAGFAAAGSPVPATPVCSAEEEPAGVMTPDSFWALLSPTDREQLGLRLSRLILKAVRPPTSRSEEDA
jgi:hypothetical protein